MLRFTSANTTMLFRRGIPGSTSLKEIQAVRESAAAQISPMKKRRAVFRRLEADFP